jgi:hypothetical protein
MQDLIYATHTRFDARAKREEANFVPLPHANSEGSRVTKSVDSRVSIIFPENCRVAPLFGEAGES